MLKPRDITSDDRPACTSLTTFIITGGILIQAALRLIVSFPLQRRKTADGIR